MEKGMKILVANLGSTSFKYRLFEMQGEFQLARGAVERIGAETSRCVVQIGSHSQELTTSVPDHVAAVRQCLAQLTDPVSGCLSHAGEVAGIGFKAVHGGHLTGVRRVTDAVLQAMESVAMVAPAHNPPYIQAMRLLNQRLPEIPLVAAFETDFHRTIPDRLRYYAIPKQWSDEWAIQKWGFHGASHRFISWRIAELMDSRPLRVISCHLGGSSSLCAIRDGQSVATSMGMSPQTGVPQNNRVGDFDPFALPLIMARTGYTLGQVLSQLASAGGLLGISGISGDIRDLEQLADQGNPHARLALDVYVSEVRRYLGGMLVELGGADALVFTGGIGENGDRIRQAVCNDLGELGIVLDEQANVHVAGEAEIGAATSRTRIWVIPTNEELVVARLTHRVLKEG
jgi:acetate kinase